MSEASVDVAIVGAGPIGLELAVALKRAGVSYVQFDAKQIGYTISWFAPQTRFFSSNERIAIAGVPLMTSDQAKATREEYLTYLRRVVQEFDLQIQTYEQVCKVERGAEGMFTISTESQTGSRRYLARKVVMATGGTARPRMLNIPGENLPHVSHYFQDPHAYFRKKILIVGGKNSAVETALRCYNAGAEVTISYRRGTFNEKSIKYWLMPEITGLIQAGRIKGIFESTPREITPTQVAMELADGKRVDAPADFVLLLTGYEADMDLLRNAGVKLIGDCQNPTYDPETMETNVSGLYVAGTAIGGTQDKYTVFIENCHVHVERIVRSLTGKRALVTQVETFGREES
ncbi:MAG TPA: NAD(P)-binding domain-containing protein [Tepidisphaeraceae bacterium]|nr:NAD(P)-binding domain-containing protein [Tepidisphaeraceae bacterium]